MIYPYSTDVFLTHPQATDGILEKTGHGHAGTDRRTRTDGRGHERRTVMEKTGTYGKDGQLWKRRALMEKTDTYGKDGHFWKRRALMEKTGTYGKDGHLWKRRICVYIF